MKYIGTISMGLRAPIIKPGDNIVDIVCESIDKAVTNDGIELNDRDIVCVTEAVVAISQSNFASIDDISMDVQEKFNGETIGLVFPILSRNRFSVLLRGIRKGVKKLVLQLSYPADEVGNRLISEEELINANINPYQDSFTLEEFRKLFPNTKHIFTGVDYIEFYKDIIGVDAEIIFSNNPKAILKYTDEVIVASIHNRGFVKGELVKAGAKKVICLDEILNKPINNSGYSEYGLLGSNYMSDTTVKLFPRNCFEIVNAIQMKLKEKYGKTIEVMVYGDGAFKDPRGGIWELADPVVSPGYTVGLHGTPNELKFKYIARTVKDEEEIKTLIKNKTEDNRNKDTSLGTTPRQIADLLGSLADLTSGSGDKGTPIVLIKNYFTNYAN